MGKSDIMATMGLDISGIREGLEKAENSIGKLSKGGKGNLLAFASGVAVAGAALYSYSKKGQEAFDTLIKGSEDFRLSLGGVAKTGGVMDIAGGLSEATGHMKKLEAASSDAVGKFNSFGAVLKSSIGELFGNDSTAKTVKKLGAEQRELVRESLAASKALMALSDDEIRVAKMRADGDEKGADALEKRLQMEREIAKIRSLNVDEVVKDKLVEAKTAKSAAADAVKAANEKADAAEKSNASIMRASDELQRADEEGIKQQEAKLSLASRIAIANKKVADAEQQVSKHVNGTLGYYMEMAKLSNARNAAAQLFSERAVDYTKSFAQGRAADRDREKAAKAQARGEKRLRDADARKRGAVRGAASGLGAQQVGGGDGRAAPAIQPNHQGGAQGAGQEMRVATLIVEKLKHA